MGILLDRLNERKLLVSDGAWGTLLQAKGIRGGDCPEEWNISHSDEVKSVAAAYAEAGSDMILTNTFGGSVFKLAKMNHADRVAEFNSAGARLSLEAAPQAIIAGSVGPTGEFIEPIGDVSEEQMEAAFSEQIAAILGAGLKVICVETMSALEEATCAIRAARKLDPSVDVIVTMTFATTPKGYRTMTGIDPSRAGKELIDAGADVVGSNCGNGIEQMIGIAAELRKITDAPILIQPNAGLPELIQGKTVYRQSPEQMASKVKDLIEAGANIVGGCCGTTPDHIVAMKAEVDKLRG